MFSQDSFKIGRDVEKEFLPEIIEENWTKIEKGTWSAQILSDLVAYYLFIEDYENCRKCLEKLKAIDPNISKKGILFSFILFPQRISALYLLGFVSNRLF